MSVCLCSLLVCGNNGVFSPLILQIEEEKQRKREAKKEERAKKRKQEKEAASKETEPKAKKARQVKDKHQSQFGVSSKILPLYC